MHARSPAGRLTRALLRSTGRAGVCARLHRRSSGPRESTYAATATWAGRAAGAGSPASPPLRESRPRSPYMHMHAAPAEPSRKRATSSVRAGRRGDDRAPHHPIQQQLARFTATCAVLVVSHVVGPSVSGRARGRTTTSHLNLMESWTRPTVRAAAPRALSTGTGTGRPARWPSRDVYATAFMPASR